MAFTVCLAGTAKGINKVRRGAVYKMRETYDTIAPAYQTTKGPVKIMPATWVYRPGRVNVLVKGSK